MLKTFHDALMPFHLALPATSRGILNEVQFDVSPMPEPRCVLRGGHELCAREVEVALTRSFLG